MTRKTSLLVLVVIVALIAAIGAGPVGASVQEPALDAATQTEEDAEDIRVRIVHASPDAPPVDVSLDGEIVASSIAFGEEASVEVDQPGNYSVEIATADDETAVSDETTDGNETATDDGSDVLYSENVTFESGMDYTIAAAGEVTTDAPTTFEPVVVTENATTIGDNETAIGLVHLSPDAPSVDVTENETGEVIFENVSYAETTEQVPLPAGDYTLDVRVESEANDGEIVESVDVTLAGGSTYMAFAIGYVAIENVSEEQSFTVLLSDDAGIDEEGNTTETPTEGPTEDGAVTETPTEDGTTPETPAADGTDS